MGGGLESHIRSKRLSIHGLAIVLASVWLGGIGDRFARPTTEFLQVYESQPLVSFGGVAVRLGSTVEGDGLRFAGRPAILVNPTYPSFALADTPRQAVG